MTSIKRVAVCGAGGTMGAGIAIVAARAGFETLSYDVSSASLERSREETERFFGKSVERGKMTAEDRDATLARMTSCPDLGDLDSVDLVIEAVFEELEVKQALLGKLDAVCPPHTVFASNTSTLSITEIASGCERPEQVVGMHFCLPAQLMKLIEMSPGLRTSEETFNAAWSFTEALGQIPVKTQDKPGFILNAFVVPFNNDAIRAVEAGVASASDIDAALKTGLGYKMGPLELLDLVGLDTQVRLCEAFYPITLDPRCSAPPLLRRMVAAGLLGRKSGSGFYSYEGGRMYGS